MLHEAHSDHAFSADIFLPKEIDGDQIAIERTPTGHWTISYPSLGPWPVYEKKDGEFSINISKSYSDRKDGVKNWVIGLNRFSRTLRKGQEILRSNRHITLKELRFELEKAYHDESSG